MQQAERRSPESLWSWLIIENKKCMMGIFHGPAGAAWPAIIITVIIIMSHFIKVPTSDLQKKIRRLFRPHVLAI